MIAKKYLQYKAITKNTLAQYLEEKFGKGYTCTLKKSCIVEGVKPLLQSDYGLEGDCTVTSMTCILEFLHHKPIQQTYDTIEKIDMKYGYNGTMGTLPIFINTVLKQAEKQLGCKQSSWKSGYGKGIGFCFDTIVKCVDKGKPAILSMLYDGRNYYNNHSVTVIGYAQYLVNGRNQRFILLYDNWTKEKTYLDYELLGAVSSLNYYN